MEIALDIVDIRVAESAMGEFIHLCSMVVSHVVELGAIGAVMGRCSGVLTVTLEFRGNDP